MKEITSDQAARWDFGNFFVLFGLPKMIVVDADGIYSEIFKKNFQDTLLQMNPTMKCGGRSVLIRGKRAVRCWEIIVG